MFVSFKKILKQKRGFSLVELIIVVAIFLVITTLILLNQSKFSSNVLINNQAYQIALSLREIQTYGIGSKTDSTNVKLGYGAHFGPNTTGDPKLDLPNGFAFFTDSQTSGSQFIYDNAELTSLRPVTLTEGQTILRYCVESSGTWQCSDNGGINSLDIVFVRPNPISHITADGVSYTKAIIMVSSTIGDKCRTVRVRELGLISVDPIVSTDPSGCSLPL